MNEQNFLRSIWDLAVDDADANRAQAMTAMRICLRRSPDDGLMLLQYSRLLIFSRRYTEAEAILTRLTPWKAEFGRREHLVAWIELYEAKGDFRTAEMHCRQLVQIDNVDDQEDSMCRLGQLIEDQGQLAAAEAVYRAAAEQFPDATEPFLLLALVLRAQERYPEAERILWVLKDKSPNSRRCTEALEDIRKAKSIKER